jgi:hypothetical protein
VSLTGAFLVSFIVALLLSLLLTFVLLFFDSVTVSIAFSFRLFRSFNFSLDQLITFSVNDSISINGLSDSINFCGIIVALTTNIVKNI